MSTEKQDKLGWALLILFFMSFSWYSFNVYFFLKETRDSSVVIASILEDLNEKITQ